MDDLPATAAVRLYSTWQIGLAAFIGAPVAGCWFLSRNYLHLGQPRRALVCLAGGVLATAALVCVWELAPWPDRFPDLAVSLADGFVLWRIAQTVHGPAVRQHVDGGGQLGSWYLVAGLSLLFLDAVILLIFGMVGWRTSFLPED